MYINIDNIIVRQHEFSKDSYTMKKSHPNLHLIISTLIIIIFLFSSLVSVAMAQSETRVLVNVGVVLDDHKYSITEDIWLRCMNMAREDFYAAYPHYNTRLVFNTRHCKPSVVSAAAAAVDLIKNEGVKAIMGPVTSMETSFVINLGNKSNVPVISFSATSPSLTSLRVPYFFQFAQPDSSLVKAISAVVETFGWRQVVPIYIDTEYGKGIITYLTDALQEVQARVPYRSVIPSTATEDQIVQELSKLKSMESRVFIVHMTTDLASKLFVKAKEIGMMSVGYVWLSTSEILDRLHSQNFTVIDSMQGVLGVQTFVPQTEKLEDLKIRLKQQFHVSDGELDVYGVWAYDAVSALAMAIEQVFGTKTRYSFRESHVTSNHSSDLEGLPVFPYGPELCAALSSARFQGIAENFSVVGRQRESSTFKIVNVDGSLARTIGFWTLKKGLVKTLSLSAVSIRSSSKFELGPIRWPGNSPSVPKGWEIPARAGKFSICSQESYVPSNHSTDLEGFPVSPHGPDLCKALSPATFQGIAENFSVVDRQREPSNFHIVNVNGGVARTIGFWTLEKGLVETLNPSAKSSKVSSSNFEFGPIRWPGDSLSVPKGWEIPIKGKKLRIGVPVKVDFTMFVKVAKNKTNTTVVTGFSVDVFEAAVKLLPYDLPYEFIPFAKPDGTSAGTYNQLCNQVYLGNFDAVVGDTTIRADRSLYVDFTMPYSESGVAMVVPVIDLKSKHVLAFLRPWTWDLWLTIGFFFVYIGFVVWVLEHRVNKEFRGPLLHQVGTSIWFSCSTMVFAHRERLVSNLARFVIIIWLFVVLILTINYTASLSSLYTLEQLQPKVTDIEDLLRHHDNVGYNKDSFGYDLLKQVGFNDSRLKGFETMEEIDEALSKGTANGGIAAFVHGTPKIKIFLAKYCSKYTLIGPIFKTDGLAFVFPKHSPLVADVSRAILNITGGEEILNLEKKWFEKVASCLDSIDAAVSGNTRGLGSFWVLFLIAGVAALLALIIFVASFIYRHRYMLVQPADSEPSTWRKIRALIKIFNEKDLSSHVFRSHRQSDALMDSPNNFPGTVVHHNSDHTDQSSLFVGEQQTSSVVEEPSVKCKVHCGKIKEW